MREAIERFLTAKRAENASVCTIRAYRSDLHDLVKFVGPEQGPAQLTRTTVRGFLAFLSRRGSSKPTVLRKLAAVKSFTSWLTSEAVLADDVCDGILGIDGPKLPKVLPDVPSSEEMLTLLDGAFPTAFPERDRLILELLYGDGLRVSEVAHISVDDLRPEQDVILIHGKGGKTRLVPLNPFSRKALGEYLAARIARLRRLKLKTPALFFGVRGLRTCESISVRNVARMLLEITKARGLQPMHPHLLRHACATHMLDNGASLDIIGQLLGHSNLDTTAHYAQVSTRLMMEAYNRAHPHVRTTALERSKNLPVEASASQ